MPKLSLWSARARDRVPTPSTEQRLCELLTTGGDARILPDGEGMNRYYGFVRPTTMLAYGSSTISSISADALQQLVTSRAAWADTALCGDAYAGTLDAARGRLRRLFAHADTDIVFAASGTDLEYVGLACVPAPAGAAVDAILLGRDEVGSGCIHSAAGRFFAESTAMGTRVAAAQSIDAEHGDIRLIDIPVRHDDGTARSSADVRDAIVQVVEQALAARRHPVVHVVHGSKTGLILPAMADVAWLAARYDACITLVIDGCQARVTPDAVRAYLALGATVLMTGSKFAGGPPFSGFALIPPARKAIARPLSPGYAAIFARAEWPADWPGRDGLPHVSNVGLALRLEAALFEFERFAAVPPAGVAMAVNQFADAVALLTERLGTARIKPHTAAEAGLCALHPLAMRSLHTIDLGQRWPHADFAWSQALHGWLSRHAFSRDGHPIRLGQPVRTRLRPDGRHAGTLRLSLSMPQIAALAALDPAASAAHLHRDLTDIADAIEGGAATLTHGPQRAAA